MPDLYVEPPLVFIKQVGNALLRVAALIVLIGAHWALGFVFSHLNHISYKPASVLLEASSYIVFALIYVYLAWDVAKIFIPWLRPKPYPGTEKERHDGAQA